MRRREDEAAARLYDSFGPPLFRYAVMILGQREAAEDVIQQVFVAVLDRGTRHIADPQTYLRAAVRNACYSLLRAGRVCGSNASVNEDLLEAPKTPATGNRERPDLAPDLGVAVALEHRD